MTRLLFALVMFMVVGACDVGAGEDAPLAADEGAPAYEPTAGAPLPMSVEECAQILDAVDATYAFLTNTGDLADVPLPVSVTAFGSTTLRYVGSSADGALRTSCSAAGALGITIKLLEQRTGLHVSRVFHVGSVSRRFIAGTDQVSSHYWGLGVDLDGVMVDGERYTVSNDFGAPIMQAFDAALQGTFDVVLDPGNDARHQDHLHCEMAHGARPDVSLLDEDAPANNPPPSIEPPTTEDPVAGTRTSDYVAIYRWVTAEGAYCLSRSDETYPAACGAGYHLSREAFIIPDAPFDDDLVELRQCSREGADNIAVAVSDPDFDTLLSTPGEDCTTMLGYIAPSGVELNVDDPWDNTCRVFRLSTMTASGLGTHLYSIGADSLANTACEKSIGTAYSNAVDCFASPPPGC